MLKLHSVPGPTPIGPIVDFAVERVANLQRLRTVIALLGILDDEFLALLHGRLRAACGGAVLDPLTIEDRIRGNAAATRALLSEREYLALQIGPTALRAAGVRT